MVISNSRGEITPNQRINSHELQDVRELEAGIILRIEVFSLCVAATSTTCIECISNLERVRKEQFVQE
eukprot:6028483-Amphidinium_carterae.1